MHSMGNIYGERWQRNEAGNKAIATFGIIYPSHKDFIKFPNRLLMKNKTLSYFTYFLNIRIKLAFQALHPIYIN